MRCIASVVDLRAALYYVYSLLFYPVLDAACRQVEALAAAWAAPEEKRRSQKRSSERRRSSGSASSCRRGDAGGERDPAGEAGPRPGVRLGLPRS